MVYYAWVFGIDLEISLLLIFLELMSAMQTLKMVADYTVEITDGHKPIMGMGPVLIQSLD